MGLFEGEGNGPERSGGETNYGARAVTNVLGLLRGVGTL